MKSLKTYSLDELLQMSLTEEVFERILEVVEEQQRTLIEHRRPTLTLVPV